MLCCVFGDTVHQEMLKNQTLQQAEVHGTITCAVPPGVLSGGLGHGGLVKVITAPKHSDQLAFISVVILHHWEK